MDDEARLGPGQRDQDATEQPRKTLWAKLRDLFDRRPRRTSSGRHHRATGQSPDELRLEQPDWERMRSILTVSLSIAEQAMGRVDLLPDEMDDLTKAVNTVRQWLLSDYYPEQPPEEAIELVIAFNRRFVGSGRQPKNLPAEQKDGARDSYQAKCTVAGTSHDK